MNSANHTKSKKLALLYPFVFFVATSMFVRSWVHAFYSSWPMMLAGCLLSVILVPQFFRTRWFFCIALYSFVILLNWQLGDNYFDSPMMVANEIANLFLFSSFCFYCFKSNDERCIKVTILSMLVLIGIASIGSFIVNQISQSIVREQSALAEMGNEDVLISYYRMGLSNYLLPHGLPAIIPPLVLIIKRSKHEQKIRLLASVFLALTLLLVYFSGSTTVLILSALCLLTFFINVHNKSEKANRVVLFFSILILSLLFLPGLLTDINSLFSGEIGENYSSHFEDIKNYSLEEEGGNTEKRIGLYKSSIDEFLKNPIIGTNKKASDHSVILDRLGVLGLVGIIPFLGIILFYRKYVRGFLDRVENIYFNFTFLSMFFMLLLKGIDDKEIWLMFFVVAPLLFYVSLQLKCKK